MTWFWIALIGPVVWSLSNHIDKLLLSKYFHGQSSAPLVLISALAGIFIALPLWFFLDSVSLPVAVTLAFMATGMIEIIYLFPYFKALEQDEVSMVVPLYQMIPVLYFVLAYIFIGETLTESQIIGSIIVLAGSLITIVDPRTLQWNWRVFLLILLSSLIYVSGGILFKNMALEKSFAVGLFWQYIGSFLFGLMLLLFPRYRLAWRALASRGSALFGTNLLNEIINLAGYVAMRYAGFLVPLALAQTVNGFQPLFVFLWGALGVLLLPRLGFEEDLSRPSIIKKIFAATLLLIGAWMLR